MKYILLSTVLAVLLWGCNQQAQNKNNEEKETKYASPQSSISVRPDRYEEGKLVYTKHCKVCHQANRKGIPKIYPPLKNTEKVKGDKDFLIEVVLNGMNEEIIVEGIKYKGMMASYRNLSDQEIADVLNYIRKDSDAKSDLILASDVKRKR